MCFSFLLVCFFRGWILSCFCTLTGHFPNHALGFFFFFFFFFFSADGSGCVSARMLAAGGERAAAPESDGHDSGRRRKDEKQRRVKEFKVSVLVHFGGISSCFVRCGKPFYRLPPPWRPEQGDPGWGITGQWVPTGATARRSRVFAPGWVAAVDMAASWDGTTMMELAGRLASQETGKWFQ